MPSQIPECVKNYKKIKIVYHKDVIPEEYLPTYNSGVIELFLWKIKGLSEHYIYVNDDMYPIGELSKDDFFDEDGKRRVKDAYREIAVLNISREEAAEFSIKTRKKAPQQSHIMEVLADFRRLSSISC